MSDTQLVGTYLLCLAGIGLIVWLWSRKPEPNYLPIQRTCDDVDCNDAAVQFCASHSKFICAGCEDFHRWENRARVNGECELVSMQRAAELMTAKVR